MKTIAFQCLIAFTFIVAVSTTRADWVNFNNETATRLPTGPGLNDPALTTTDAEERDMAWGDVDHDGDIDLIIVRKIPFSFPGGRRNLLMMNEGIADGHTLNGVLVDRTAQFASIAVNVPPEDGVSAGLLDLTNDRDVQLADVNNDGWLDIITATTVSDGLPRFLGHPRIYINRGEIAGAWQGFVYDYHSIPQLLSKTGVACNPRFATVAVGDVTGDGYVDLFFADYDTSETGPDEQPSFDMDSKLLINQGVADPGVFVDETIPRLAANYNYGSIVGVQNLAHTSFGAATAIGDMNGDGLNDLVKNTTLTPPQHVATITNRLDNPGHFASTGYKVQNGLSPYYVSVGDLNRDGRLDMVVTDDAQDRYHLNTGNDAAGNPNFLSLAFTSDVTGVDSFGDESIIADLDNDGWKDVLINDVHVDGMPLNRRLRIMHNRGDGPNVTLREETPSVIPIGSLSATHDVAAFDLNGDGWKDLVIARHAGTSVWMNVPPCPADISGNGLVNVEDLLALLGHWGEVGGPADLTSDGMVNVGDLLALISGWGACTK